jgi:Ca-activated chloride channel family protein
VSFSSPLVLIALLAIPALIAWYVGHQRRRTQAAEAFVAPALTRSVAPKRPGWRRHVPMIAFALALAVLIVAAARPQRTKAVPINSAAIMLANDVSNSMQATDVSPTRLAAAKQAALKFVAGVPSQVLVGQMQFARRPVVLQSPTTDHAQTQAAIAGLNPGGGGTAIGETLTTALHSLTALKSTAGKRLPSAIVLLSDGTSNVGQNPVIAARQAKADHIPIYTIAIGTANGTIPVKRGNRAVTTPVPVSPQQLAQIASTSGGHAYTAANSADARAVYSHLAKQLGHKKVKDELTYGFAGGALALLLVGGGLSLFWFGRLA